MDESTSGDDNVRRLHVTPDIEELIDQLTGHLVGLASQVDLVLTEKTNAVRRQITRGEVTQAISGLDELRTAAEAIIQGLVELKGDHEATLTFYRGLSNDG